MLEGEIQGKQKRGHPRNNYITQACKDIEVQKYVKLKIVLRTADGGET